MVKFESQLVLEEGWTKKYMKMLGELKLLVPDSIIRNNPTDYVSQFSQDFLECPYTYG